MELSNSPVQKNTPIPKREFRNQQLNFELKDTPIDYFKITKELIDGGDDLFNVSVHDVDFGDDKYLDVDNHLEPFDYAGTDTTVFNFQTGKGKSTAFYNMIELYVEAGYYIIVCSPFQKLVEKDYAALNERFSGQNVFNYLDIQNDDELSEADYKSIISKRVQVMTINCLLQNPGEKYQDQTLVKRKYLTKLKQHIKDSEKKVVIFFDELHEAIKNFKSEFISNLLTWKELTHKCFVSSATFTFASIPVIRYISLLTEVNIKIYEAKREKSNTLARLHLHLTSTTYHKTYLSPLSYLKILINRYKAENRKINILTGQKILAKALINPKSTDSLPKGIMELSPVLLTRDTPQNQFNSEGHNIGTTFKTGIDLEDENAVLIIILPAIEKDNETHYGIFTDGLPSLIQSVSRVRNGGDIHLFMLAPPVIIDLKNHKGNISEVLRAHENNSEYYSINDVFDKLKETEDYKLQRAAEGHQLIQDISKVAPELGIYPYTINNYLMDYSTIHSVNKYESMGKYLSPYVLWASINEQFCNAKLHSITYLTRYHKEIRLTKENQFSQMIQLLSESEKNKLKTSSIRKGFIELPNCLESSTAQVRNEKGVLEEISYLHQFYQGDKTISLATLKNLQSYRRLFLQILFFLKTEQVKELEKEEYIKTCIANAIAYSGTGEMPELIVHYKQLAEIKGRFIQFVIGHLVPFEDSAIIHKDYGQQLPENLYRSAIIVINELKKKDSILVKCFSIFQKQTEPSKETVANELELFTNITSIQKTYNGERNKYYLVNEPISNNSYLQGINFLE